MPGISDTVVAAISRRLSGLRFPTLFVLLVGLFLLDLLIPDIVPFVDEILLGILTLIVGNLRRRPRENDPG